MKKLYIKLVLAIISIFIPGASAGEATFFNTQGLLDNFLSRNGRGKVDNEHKKYLRAEYQEFGGILLDLSPRQLYTMIICSDVDYLSTMLNIVPVLERAEHKILDPMMDLTPGLSRTAAYSSAVSQSKNFVVVMTQDFRKDSWNNIFVFGLLVLTRLFQGQVQGEVLILKSGLCNIPNFFTYHPQISIVDLTSAKTMTEIRHWADRTKIK